MHKRIFAGLFIAQLLCFAYLLWWNYKVPYYGYFEHKYWNFFAFIFNLFLMLSFIVFAVKAFFSGKKMLALLLFPLVWMVIFFAIFGKHVIFYREDEDFSVIERIRLYDDGTYDLTQIPQQGATYEEGRYICRNDSVLLSEKGVWNRDSAHRILSAGNSISFRGSYIIRNVEVKEKDSKYWKRLLVKWLWMR